MSFRSLLRSRPSFSSFPSPRFLPSSSSSSSSHSLRQPTRHNNTLSSSASFDPSPSSPPSSVTIDWTTSKKAIPCRENHHGQEQAQPRHKESTRLFRYSCPPQNPLSNCHILPRPQQQLLCRKTFMIRRRLLLMVHSCPTDKSDMGCAPRPILNTPIPHHIIVNLLRSTLDRPF